MDIIKKQNEEKDNINQHLDDGGVAKANNINENMHSYEHCHDHSQEDSYEHTDQHIHQHTDQHTHQHTNQHTDQHTHQHTHQNTKAVINRLSRAIGHMEAVKKMVEDGRDCSDVLIQLAAVRSAINNTGKVILKDHIQNCIVEAIEENNLEKIEKMNKAIDQFI